MVASHLPQFPVDNADCLNTLCTLHHSSLDLFCDNLARYLYDCAEVTIPKSHPSHSVPGWNSSARLLKEKAKFWHVVCKQAGSPVGVLHQLKKSARSRYKYEVKCLKRREHHIRREKMAAALASSNSRNFWKHVKNANRSKKSQSIDGHSGDEISSLFSSKFQSILNSEDVSECDSLFSF